MDHIHSSEHSDWFLSRNTIYSQNVTKLTNLFLVILTINALNFIQHTRDTPHLIINNTPLSFTDSNWTCWRTCLPSVHLYTFSLRKMFSLDVNIQGVGLVDLLLLFRFFEGFLYCFLKWLQWHVYRFYFRHISVKPCRDLSF